MHTFQKLVATLRRLQREAPPPKVRPKSASAGSATQAALRPKGDLMSSDDGGAPAPPKQVDEEEMGGGSQVVPKRKFKRTTPIDLEIDHVRRQLMGRAMTLGRTTNGVVYEHQVYHEGLQRARRVDSLFIRRRGAVPRISRYPRSAIQQPINERLAVADRLQEELAVLINDEPLDYLHESIGARGGVRG